MWRTPHYFILISETNCTISFEETRQTQVLPLVSNG